MTLEELKTYLIEEAEYNEEEVENMTAYELVDAYFTYEGVIGFTYDLLSVVEAAYGVELDIQ